jgi:hypothetical protein
MLASAGLEHRLSLLASNSVYVEALTTLEERDLHLLPLPAAEIKLLSKAIQGARRHQHDASAFFDDGNDSDDDILLRKNPIRSAPRSSDKVPCPRCRTYVSSTFQ